MRKSIFLCLAFIASPLRPAFAQGWAVVNPSVREGALTFITNDSGFIIADSLYVTTDGGRNFQARALPPGPSLPFGLSRPGYSFPTPAIGYLSEELSPGAGYEIVMTTDSGNTWSSVYHTNYRLGPVLFRSPAVGLFVQFGLGDVPEIGYTADSMHQVRLTNSIPFDIQGQESTFLEWSDNGNWYVQYQGLVRSTDSGGTWRTVLRDDQSGTSYGIISAACFHGNRGFAFGDGQHFAASFETTDAGGTWPQVLPTSPYIPSTFCSMPSDSVAYVIASDSARTVLLKIELPVEDVKTIRNTPVPFVVSSSGTEIRFYFESKPSDEKIEVFDMLGRKCAELPLAPMSTSAILQASALQPGSYFARLGNSVAKFIVR